MDFHVLHDNPTCMAPEVRSLFSPHEAQAGSCFVLQINGLSQYISDNKTI